MATDPIDPIEDDGTFVYMDNVTRDDYDDGTELKDVDLCYSVAQTAMEATGAGFAIIGSPKSFINPQGERFPTGVAVLISQEIELTNSDVATVLENICKQLRKPVEKVEAAANESL